MHFKRENLRPIHNRALSWVFEDYHGVRLTRKYLSIVWYLILLAILIYTVFQLDKHTYTRRFIHSSDSNAIFIGITTILLALLIPVAIALVEDARKSVLERQAIIRSIIRLAFLPIAIALICAFLLIPEGLNISGVSITVRTIMATVVLSCFYFILMAFYRSYRWLSDGSVYSSGSPETPSPDSPQPDAITSYRFAQLVRLLSGAKGYETWLAIWQQWFPIDYENTLHAAFFKRQDEVLTNKRTKRYIILSLELEAYEKYFSKRNKNNWWFSSEYLKKFLLMYAEVEKIINKDRSSRTTTGLWRGKAALERLLRRMISDSMNGDHSWDLFEAMDEYIKAADLLEIGKSTNLKNSVILTHFVTELLEHLYSDRLDAFNVRADLVDRDHWLITYDNLYEKRYNVTFVIEEIFKNWFFKKLDNIQNISNAYAFDSIFDVLFLGSDVTTIADMYWFMYKGKNTTDSDLIVRLYYENARPFGLFGRVSVAQWADDEEVRMDGYRKEHAREVYNAIRLFSTLYYPYFEAFWELNKLIASTRKALRRKTLKDKEKVRLEYLLSWLVGIREFYKTERSKNKKDSKGKKNAA